MVKELHLLESELELVVKILNGVKDKNMRLNRKDPKWLNFCNTLSYLQQTLDQRDPSLLQDLINRSLPDRPIIWTEKDSRSIIGSLNGENYET